jgi:hypothetical protein
MERRESWKLKLVAGALCLGLPSLALAVPVTYQLQTFGGPASGSLGGIAFTNANIALTFDGDTRDVVAFSMPGAFGYEILKGTATVTVFQGDLPSLTATFLPSAGIYVSVDGKNSGVGFGSFGVLPSDSTFPGEPVYPMAEYTSTGAVATYDLASDVTVVGFPVSCVGFATPAQCATPIALPTTAGDLRIDSFASVASIFRAQLHSAVPFASLSVEAELKGSPPSRFEVEGRLTLGAGSNGIDPTTEPVTLQLGTWTATISPGLFRRHRSGTFVYAGVVGGVALGARLTPRGGGTYAFLFEGSGGLGSGVTAPLSVTLTIGDDTGTAIAGPEADHSD